MSATEWSRLVKTASPGLLQRLGEYVKRLVELERLQKWD